MNRLLTILLLLAAAPAGLPAQDPVPLTVGRVHADSVVADEVDAYTIDLDGSWFVLGEADQQTVDVVVTVFDPEGARIASVDGPARGPEVFHFDTETAGRYRIEVRPFEEGAGRYAIVVRRAEPVAARPEARVDQLMAAYDGPGVPGGVVGVIRDGELVFAKAYGLANLTHDVPFATDTRTNIGSTSKQFAAFAIALLAERGELSLDDDVRTHIPELPDFGETVTLRHLLTHTSGYREFLNAFALAGRQLGEGDHIGRHEIIALVQRQPELQNAPGTEWNYNNTAFALLTVVVERVTGQPFPGWMRENVFEPLGMTRTAVRADPLQIVPNSAQGYAPAEEGGWRQAPDLGGAMGAGGIYTTVADLARWLDNFDEAPLGSPAIFRQMTTPYVLADGDTTDYGLGLFVDEYRGLRRVHHGGADVAHRSMLRYFPDLDAGVVALSNNATFNSAAIADDVADAFFEDRMEPEEDPAVAAAFDPEDYDPEAFEELEGRYALEAMPSFVLHFFREGDTLFTQATGQPRVRMTPTSDSTFRLVGVEASVTFHRSESGPAESATLHQNGNHLAHRIEEEGWSPDAAELQSYAGRYFSPELQTFYTVALEDDELVIRHRRFEEDVELTPGQERDEFTGTFPIAELKFLRGDDGEITGLEVSNVRTRGVRFDRQY